MSLYIFGVYMVCFKYVIVNTLHRGGYGDCDDYGNYDNNIALVV
jgi:hypothetical protein